MTRDEAAAFIGERFGAYLAAVNRSASDSAGNLKSAIDDALRALGYATADLATAAPTDPEAEEDFRVQVSYRTMTQVVRDMGTLFDLSSEGDSLKLSQMKANAEAELARLESFVLARFGSLGVVGASDSNPFATLDINDLVDQWAVV